jgi:hypothetical protein
MRDQGLDPLIQSPVPDLPENWGFQISSNGHAHVCEQEQWVDLPLILVCPVRLLEPAIPDYGSPECTWMPRETFTPYWLVGARLIHDWAPYPPEPHRSANAVEAACILAQEPRFGSIQIHPERGSWGHRRFQVYKCPERNRFVVSGTDCGGYNKHVVLVRYSIGLHEPQIDRHVPRKIVDPPKAAPVPPAPTAGPPSTATEGESPPAAPSPPPDPPEPGNGIQS